MDTPTRPETAATLGVVDHDTSASVSSTSTSQALPAPPALLRQPSLPAVLRPRTRLPSDEPVSVVRSRRWDADGPLMRPADAPHLRTVSQPIDVDMLRGLTFYSATAVNPAATRALFLRVVLFPVYPRFWRNELSVTRWILLSVLYLVQLATAVLWYVPSAGELAIGTQLPLDGLLMYGTEASCCMLLLAVFGAAYARANAARFPVDDHYDSSGDEGDPNEDDVDGDEDEDDDEDEDGDDAAPDADDSCVVHETGAAMPKQPAAQRCSDTDTISRGTLAAHTKQQDRGGAGAGAGTGAGAGAEPGIKDTTRAADTADDPPAVGASTMDTKPSSATKPRALRDGAVIVKAKMWDANGDLCKRVVTLRQCYELINHRVVAVRERHWSSHAASVTYLPVLLALIPTIFRLYMSSSALLAGGCSHPRQIGALLLRYGVGQTRWVCFASLLSASCMWVLSRALLQLLAGAERALHLRFLAAKFFTAVTSLRRARRYRLPHFRLHKISNIKMWLSLRAAVRRRGSRRSVDMVVGLSFFLALLLVTVMMVLQVTGDEQVSVLSGLEYWMTVSWATCISFFLLRYLTLGTRINTKYNNNAALLTEQINVHLRTFRFPEKKAELSAANSILGLAQKLLKELEAPSTVSGLSMSPYLYHVTRVVVLSAFSAVLSDMLGFKLKVWKFKM